MNFCKRLEREENELLVAARTYNPSCLIGNWTGEVMLQEVNKLPLWISVLFIPFLISYFFSLFCLLFVRRN